MTKKHSKDGWTIEQIYADIVTLNMVAKGLDVDFNRVNRWMRDRKKIGSPEPIRKVGPGQMCLFSMADWHDWYADWLKKHENRKGFQNTKPHGAGKSFWTYFEDE